MSDVEVLQKDATRPVGPSTGLLATGWPGGLGVCWGTTTKDSLIVTPSTGPFASGFLLWGSSESGNQYIGFTSTPTQHQIAVMCSGAWVILTSTYEKYTWASRQAGPLVEVAYTLNAPLYFSRRGYFTVEDEADLVADPLGPSIPVGFVARTRSLPDGKLGVQTTL